MAEQPVETDGQMYWPPGAPVLKPESPGDEWRTPPFVFEYMDRIHQFQVDLAATFDNALCASYYDRESDALAHEWHRGAVVGWLNPPYSSIDPWLEKARNEAGRGFTTVCLIPAPNGEKVYHKHVFGVASEVMWIEGRLAFIGLDGKPRAGNSRGSVLVTYRAYDLGHTRYSVVNRDAMQAMVASWRNGEAAA